MKMMFSQIQNIIKVFLLAGLLLVGLQAAAWAQQQTHTVRAGQTLFSIAKQYDVSVDQIREWNNLGDNELRVGQTLIVGRSQPEDAISHTVQPQETLFSISKKYRVSITELKRWNNLETNSLKVGQELTVYPPDEQSATADTAQSSLVVNTPTRSNTYYTVKSGDTLYEIARTHNMTLDELKTLNGLTSNTIRVGQRLTVREQSQAAPSVAESSSESTPQGAFVVHTVQQGSSLQSLLNKFSMTEAEFRALNPDVSSSLQSGQQVTVLLPPSRSYSNPYTVQSNLKDLGQTLVASYDTSQVGATTTSGELYNPSQLTAAHSNIALGNVIFVRNPRTNKGIYVRINDRFSGDGLKLSDAALRSLDLMGNSNTTVNMYQDQ